MGFIQKRIQQKKLEQEEQLKRECSYYASCIDSRISYFKNAINKLSTDIKRHTTITNDFALELICEIDFLEEYYERFLHDLKQEEFTYKETYFKNVKEESKQKAEFMHKLKKQYRVEFENIYNNFKRITKGVNFPRRNEILGLMRKAFDFDSSKYYSTDDQFIIMR